jgi:hypothetical protein
VVCTKLAQDWVQWRAVVNTFNKPSRYVKWEISSVAELLVASYAIFYPMEMVMHNTRAARLHLKFFGSTLP